MIGENSWLVDDWHLCALNVKSVKHGVAKLVAKGFATRFCYQNISLEIRWGFVQTEVARRILNENLTNLGRNIRRNIWWQKVVAKGVATTQNFVKTREGGTFSIVAKRFATRFCHMFFCSEFVEISLKFSSSRSTTTMRSTKSQRFCLVRFSGKNKVAKPLATSFATHKSSRMLATENFKQLLHCADATFVSRDVESIHGPLHKRSWIRFAVCC